MSTIWMSGLHVHKEDTAENISFKTDMRASQIASLIICLLFVSSILLSQAQLPLTKLGCPSKCGNITIPFPFGIGDSCSVDKWFAIDCNNTHNVPFIKSINLELLNISLEESTMRVNYPIASSCISFGLTSDSSLNLNSPFEYNNTANKFTIVGPNTISRLSFHTNTIAACITVCSDNLNVTAVETTSDCNGKGCCQTGIPLHIKEFSVSSFPLFSGCEVMCRYAFLVDQQWFVSTIKNPLVEIPHISHVPVVLNWGLHHKSFKMYEKGKPKTYGSSFRCADSENVSNESSLLRCSCKSGYEGNPYLLHGCQDIDECSNTHTNVCPFSMICQNLPGTYSCFTGVYKKSLVSTILSDVGAALGPMLVIFGGWWFRKIWTKRKIIELKEKNFKRNGGLLLQKQLSSTKIDVDHIKIFSSKELEIATDHFNIVRKLGGGGQGAVYKGMLSDGRIVAVKKSKVVDERKVREFINEVFILSQISHRNVVRVLGCCLETEVPLLVYEFISNGTLYEYLHNQNDEFPLTWERRLRIAAEVAGALSYLHSAAALPIYHRDVKSSNILLDEKYNAKIADFGISKSINIDQSHVTTMVQGTFGYIDPEYFQSNQFTEKSDVYSFGVVLVELLTGKKLATSTISGECPGLVTLFVRSTEQGKLFDMLDHQVVDYDFKGEIMNVAYLAVKCLSLTGKKRPTMKEVTQSLEMKRLSGTDPSSSILRHYEEAHEDVNDETSETWGYVSDTTRSWSVSSSCSPSNDNLLLFSN